MRICRKRNLIRRASNVGTPSVMRSRYSLRACSLRTKLSADVRLMIPKLSLMAILRSALVADKAAVKHHGRWWGPVIKNSWAGLPNSSVDGVDAASRAWKADSHGKTQRKELSREKEREYAPSVKVAQEREPAG